MTIAQVRGTTTIAALRNSEGTVNPQPPSDTVLRAGDVLVAMGTVDALKKLESLFVPGRASETGSVLGDLS
jgi:K+/H+ antiporter YhaU regulatory subunit KhtT